MSLSIIRTEIKGIMDGVTDIGVVHDYERLATDWIKFLSFYKPAGKNYIRGWSITRQKSPEKGNGEDDTAAHQYRRMHNMVIRGYYGLKDSDASEKVFQDLVETVCDTFRGKPTLNGKADDSSPPQVDIFETRMFGTVLCHYVEIRIVVEEEFIV